MLQSDHDATSTRRSGRSRLGDSLLRLQQTFSRTRQTDIVAEDRFEEWQERWAHRREQIARRLEIIDRQLEALVRDGTDRPQLSVVAELPADDDVDA